MICKILYNYKTITDDNAKKNTHVVLQQQTAH